MTESEHDTLMWEAVAALGRLPDLVAWVTSVAVEDLRREPRCREVSVYAAGDERAVVIAHFDGEPCAMPEPPPDLVARPPHQWPFRRLV
jgi:hypothetical protein